MRKIGAQQARLLSGYILLMSVLSACGVLTEGDVLAVRDIEGIKCTIDSGYVVVDEIREPPEQVEARMRDFAVAVIVSETNAEGVPTDECTTEITLGGLDARRK